MIFHTFFWLRIEGLEHLPRCGPYVLASNHASYLDPPVIGVAIPAHVRFIARQDLFTTPMLGTLIRWLGALRINQQKGTDGEVFKRARELLRQQGVVAIFPEGERSWDGALQPGQLGVSMLAMKANVPMVPVALLGTHTAYPRGAHWPRPAVITVRIGQPIYVSTQATGRAAREAYQHALDRVMGAIQQLMDS